MSFELFALNPPILTTKLQVGKGAIIMDVNTLFGIKVRLSVGLFVSVYVMPYNAHHMYNA